MSTRPGRSGGAGDARVDGAAIAHVGAHRVAAPPAARHNCSVSRSSSSITSQAQTCAPRSANARLMARPKPCAAPVTMTVLPVKVMFMDAPCVRAVAASVIECVERLRPLAALDLVNQLDQPRGERRRHAGLGAERDRRCRVAHPLRWAACAPRDRARRRCATLPTGDCARRAHRASAPPHRAARSGGTPTDRSRRRPPGGRRARRRRPGISRASAMYSGRYSRHRQRIGDGFVGERRGEEHRAVGFLAPEIAPDVRRHDRPGVEIAPRVSERGDARRRCVHRSRRPRPRRVRRSESRQDRCNRRRS